MLPPSPKGDEWGSLAAVDGVLDTLESLMSDGPSDAGGVKDILVPMICLINVCFN